LKLQIPTPKQKIKNHANQITSSTTPRHFFKKHILSLLLFVNVGMSKSKLKGDGLK